jgi:ribosomal protein S18 acetylase RimI-like enzyme
VRTKVTTYYLEMLRAGDLRPARQPRPEFAVIQAKIPSPELNAFLYRAVGRDWHWVDRLTWSREEWLAYVERPEIETWVAYLTGTPAGYFELEREPDESLQIAYFGMLPQFTGQGLGGHLLTAAIERAWSLGAARVWVHTCTLDHPAALKNYQARGMSVYKEESEDEELPEA